MYTTNFFFFFSLADAALYKKSLSVKIDISVNFSSPSLFFPCVVF